MKSVHWIRNPFLALAPQDDGYLAYDMESGRLHHLNLAATLILELSDGSRTLESLCSDLAALDASLNWNTCAEWIEYARSAGLLKLIDAEAPNPAQPAAADFLSCSRDLRDHGNVRAAFVCQRHATLLFPCEPGEWKFLGELAHIVGRRNDAREAYERYLDLCPGDEEIAHILKALRNEPAPPRAPDRCVEQLYARFADYYEDSMCGDLGYQAPARLIDAVISELGNAANLDVVDLGCGTGLFGRLLRPRARNLTGVDLSPEMIAEARKTGIYDRLDACEMTSWLKGRRDPELDLIAACDCLIYFGDLRQVLLPAAHLLRPGGWMAFTLERGETEPFRLTDSGRYSHSPSHVHQAAESAGLTVASITETILRYEYGEPVTGVVAVLRR